MFHEPKSFKFEFGPTQIIKSKPVDSDARLHSVAELNIVYTKSHRNVSDFQAKCELLRKYVKMIYALEVRRLNQSRNSRPS